MNKSIIDNLDYYLSLKDPEYAFLVSGNWGVGKTHFIDNYIDVKSNDEVRIIKISLFGLSKLSEVDEKIFQALHPILGSKFAKVTGNILKGALSLGFKVDLDFDGQSNENLNAKFEKVDLSEYFSSDGKKSKDIVVVFDDLERTDISTSKILGFINNLVESSSIKVILVANERALLENDKHYVYKDFKEKVIGKTFEVKHNFDEVLHGFLSMPDLEFLTNFFEDIKMVYVKSGYKNLRKIKQSIDDFRYLTRNINNEYLKNKIFYSNLVKSFFALSIEVKKGSLSEASLTKNEPFRKGSDSKIYEKYFLDNTHLYSGDVWVDILFKSDLANINARTAKLAYFLEKKTAEEPNWVKLWNFRKLEDSEFEELINELKNEVEELKEFDLIIYLHKISILIYFLKLNLVVFSTKELTVTVTKYIEKYKDSQKWKEHRIQKDSYFNSTGYSYLAVEDSDFIEIRNFIYDENNKSFIDNEKKEEKEKAEIVVNGLISGNVEELSNILLSTHESTPILNKIEPDIFVKNLLESDNKIITIINDIILERYSENKILNGIHYYEYLKDELPFWSVVNDKLNEFQWSNPSLKSHMLGLFSKFTISKVIKLLSPPTNDSHGTCESTSR